MSYKIEDGARIFKYFPKLSCVIAKHSDRYKDLIEIRERVPELSHEKLKNIHEAWWDFSGYACASWSTVNSESIRQFRVWLGLDERQEFPEGYEE